MVIKMKEIRERPTWDEFFMFSALKIATRSSCLYLHTGAVIVKDNIIIASGYNGAPSGIENCLKVGCRKEGQGIDFDDKNKGICRGAHAERNAMDQKSKWELKGTSIYALYYPCSTCAKSIVGNGISEIVYSRFYKEPDSLTKELFEEAGIKLRKFDVDIEKYFNMIRKI